MDQPLRTATEPGRLVKSLEQASVRWACWTFIVLVAALIRFVDLENLPAGLFRDEAEKGYNAYALATSGGAVEFPVSEGRAGPIRWRRWPAVIDVMGVKTSALYQYASVPFVRLFGLGVGSTRMAAAAAGTLTVALTGAVLLSAWRPAYALGAMLWLALCPWHYLFSRWALQGIFVPLSLIAALGGLLGVERRRWWGFPLAGGALGLMFYSYSGAQPFVLLWGLSLLVLYRRSVAAQPLAFSAALVFFLALSLPRAWVILAGEGSTRLSAVAVWGAEDATALLTLGRVIANYLAHFNPIYLFFSGDELPRHAMPGRGQLLVVDAVFLLVGVGVTLKSKLPLAWPLFLAFLCGPVGASITRIDGPHALRSIAMVLPAAIWGGVGLVATVQWVHRRSRLRASLLSQRLSMFPAFLLLAISLSWAVFILGSYWDQYRNDPEVTAAFAVTERIAFEELYERRRAGERIWINGASIAYAPYLALFYGRYPAAESGKGGLESQGLFFYDPEGADAMLSRIRPDDWIVDWSAGGATLYQWQE